MQSVNAPVDYSQDHIISNINKFLHETMGLNLELTLDPIGVCGGLSSNYLLAKGRGREEEFFANLKRFPN